MTKINKDAFFQATVAATALLHYLQADDKPSNQTSLTQQIKTGLPKAAGNVKNIASEWLGRQRQHRPSCTAKHFAFDINLFKFNMAERNQFRASATISKPKTASYLKPFYLRAMPFIFNSFANRKTFPALILNSQDGASLAHPTKRIKKRGMIHGTNDLAESAGRSPHTSPLPAHLAAAYHHPISFFETASAAPL